MFNFQIYLQKLLSLFQMEIFGYTCWIMLEYKFLGALDQTKRNAQALLLPEVKDDDNLSNYLQCWDIRKQVIPLFFDSIINV